MSELTSANTSVLLTVLTEAIVLYISIRIACEQNEWTWLTCWLVVGHIDVWRCIGCVREAVVVASDAFDDVDEGTNRSSGADWQFIHNSCPSCPKHLCSSR